jgi:integrase
VLRVALNRAIKRKLVAQNAAALADAPRVVRAEVQSLTPDEARTFLTAIADHLLYALIVVAVSCGLREGELLGLRWSDLDLDSRPCYACGTPSNASVKAGVSSSRSRRKAAEPFDSRPRDPDSSRAPHTPTRTATRWRRTMAGARLRVHDRKGHAARRPEGECDRETG